VYRTDARIEAILYNAEIPERYFGDLLPVLREVPKAHINFALESLGRLTQSPQISLDDSLGLIPPLIDAAQEYRSTLVKQDDVLTKIAKDYLAQKYKPTGSEKESRADVEKQRKGKIGHVNDSHSWRRHEKEAARDRRLRTGNGYRLLALGDDRLLLRAIDSRLPRRKYDDRDRSLGSAARLEHTNEILEYFRINDGSERSGFLKGFNGNHHHGAVVVRDTYSVGADFVFGAVGVAKDAEIKLFKALAQYVNQYGAQRARALLELVGPERFDQFTGFVASRVGSQICLIGGRGNLHTAGDLESIAKMWTGPELMAQRGYTPKDLQGFVAYTR